MNNINSALSITLLLLALISLAVGHAPKQKCDGSCSFKGFARILAMDMTARRQVWLGITLLVHALLRNMCLKSGTGVISHASELEVGKVSMIFSR